MKKLYVWGCGGWVEGYRFMKEDENGSLLPLPESPEAMAMAIFHGFDPSTAFSPWAVEVEGDLETLFTALKNEEGAVTGWAPA